MDLTSPADAELTDVEVAVIGGGQAGLSAAWHLGRLGVRHVVLEAQTVFHDWRARRWDSFCLVTPNWQCQLPGHPYDGDDPDGFMVLADLLAWLERWDVDSPVAEGVEVRRACAAAGGGFELDTTAGPVRAAQLVVATGPYTEPVRPALADRLDPSVRSLHSATYRSPDELPPGEVLVVGTGQSGCQIAEDLHLAGRRVHLATGRAPRVARRYRGRDCVAWLDEMGTYATTVAEHPQGLDKRRNVNHYVTGRDGGHDIDLRVFATEGMALYGRLLSVEGTRLAFADDLADHLDHADEVCESIKDSIDRHIAEHRIDAPVEARPVPVWQPPPGGATLDLAEAGVTSVIWSTGFRPDYRWLELPVLDEDGRPRHDRGVAPVPGVYFLGLPWLHTWGSARFSGIAADAAYVAEAAAARAAAGDRR